MSRSFSFPCPECEVEQADFFFFNLLLININKSTLRSSQLANSSLTLQWRSSTRSYLMHIQCLEQQIKVSTYWMISYQKASASEVTPSSICSCRLTPVIMRRYWWLQVSCLMNSLIDCAAIAFWQWPSRLWALIQRRLNDLQLCDQPRRISKTHQSWTQMRCAATVFKVIVCVIQNVFYLFGNVCARLFRDPRRKHAPSRFQHPIRRGV